MYSALHAFATVLIRLCFCIVGTKENRVDLFQVYLGQCLSRDFVLVEERTVRNKTEKRFAKVSVFS